MPHYGQPAVGWFLPPTPPRAGPLPFCRSERFLTAALRFVFRARRFSQCRPTPVLVVVRCLPPACVCCTAVDLLLRCCSVAAPAAAADVTRSLRSALCRVTASWVNACCWLRALATLTDMPCAYGCSATQPPTRSYVAFVTAAHFQLPAPCCCLIAPCPLPPAAPASAFLLACNALPPFTASERCHSSSNANFPALTFSACAPDRAPSPCLPPPCPLPARTVVPVLDGNLSRCPDEHNAF